LRARLPAAGALLLGALALSCAGRACADGPQIEAGFTPAGAGVSAESLVLDAIGGARHSIHVAAYTFTSRSISRALVAARQRGVEVRIVVDSEMNGKHYTAATFTANHGIPTRSNARYENMHDKFMVIDGDTVETGSFNYSYTAAQYNAENALLIRNDAKLAAAYEREWQRLWAEGREIKPRY
jgi:phosphatidylserine/phosphatidylglycerophosphate/cardiolipin synthase-like enzyme